MVDLRQHYFRRNQTVKIFYGVQATGNGHITRARALATKLNEMGLDVTYQFTGREQNKLFEMEVFGDYRWCSGLTFETQEGHVRYLRTAKKTNIPAFIQDVTTLDLREFDVVISDFEPITSWAAIRQGIKTIGIGHQYAFGYDVPKDGVTLMGVQVLKHFAPVTVGLGVHWHHFNHPILPPIIETIFDPPRAPENRIIVYLPFEDVYQVVNLLKPFSEYEFCVYSPMHFDTKNPVPEHIQVKSLSRKGFQEDFADSGGVICNSGFELTSEALNWGKKLLVKPLQRQMEQLSNAKAMEVLRLGQVMQDLDRAVVQNWLEKCPSIRVYYPDVASMVSEWLLGGVRAIERNWVESIWDQVDWVRE